MAIGGFSKKHDVVNVKMNLKDSANNNLVKIFLGFSGRYNILGYNGSQFSQLGTIFQASLNFKF